MKQTEKVVLEAARVNGIKVENLSEELINLRIRMLDDGSGTKAGATEVGFWDLWRTPVMRRNR